MPPEKAKVQSIEKYLKSYLVLQNIAPPRTHDLVELLNQCSQHDATLLGHMPLVRILDPYGIFIRYPGTTATVAEAKAAVTTMRKLRRVLRKKLGL
jgi:HEPN domain-containing protein